MLLQERDAVLMRSLTPCRMHVQAKNNTGNRVLNHSTNEEMYSLFHYERPAVNFTTELPDL